MRQSRISLDQRFAFFLTCWLLLAGCQVPATTLKWFQPNPPERPYNTLGLEKAPYTGKIELFIDPNLNKRLKGKYKVATFKSTERLQKGFKTQSLPAGDQAVWQSQTFTRTAGPPNQFSTTFTANGGTYLLQVLNGDQTTGENRLSSATVTVNDTDVASPHDFNQQIGIIEKPFTVTASGTQTVQIRL